MPARTARRDPALVPLSHDHQRTLALCLRVSRWTRVADPRLGERVAELLREIDGALIPHFRLEEEVLFPGVEPWMGARPGMIADLLEDHRKMRSLFERVRAGGRDLPQALGDLAAILEPHVRKEERVFFPLVQERVPPEVLAALAPRLAHAAFCPAGNR